MRARVRPRVTLAGMTPSGHIGTSVSTTISMGMAIFVKIMRGK